MFDKLIEFPLRMWCTGVVVGEITTLAMMGMLTVEDVKDVSATYGFDVFGVDTDKVSKTHRLVEQDAPAKQVWVNEAPVTFRLEQEEPEAPTASPVWSNEDQLAARLRDHREACDEIARKMVGPRPTPYPRNEDGSWSGLL